MVLSSHLTSRLSQLILLAPLIFLQNLHLPGRFSQRLLKFCFQLLELVMRALRPRSCSLLVRMIKSVGARSSLLRVQPTGRQRATGGWLSDAARLQVAEEATLQCNSACEWKLPTPWVPERREDRREPLGDTLRQERAAHRWCSEPQLWVQRPRQGVAKAGDALKEVHQVGERHSSLVGLLIVLCLRLLLFSFVGERQFHWNAVFVLFFLPGLNQLATAVNHSKNQYLRITNIYSRFCRFVIQAVLF